MEARSLHGLRASDVKFVWALVFDMPMESRAGSTETNHQEMAESADGLAIGASIDEAEGALPLGLSLICSADASPRRSVNRLETAVGYDLDGDGDIGEMGRPPSDKSLKITNEAWIACEKIIASDLVFRHVIPIDHRYLILAIGAPHKVLVDEASHMKLLMRLQETKGSMEFQEDLLQYYASNHGGLNEYKNHKWTRRNVSDIASHFKRDEALDEEQLALRNKRKPEVFTSALAQRIVMHRLRRVGRYDPEHQKNVGSQGGKADVRMLGHVKNRCGDRPRDIPAGMLHDLLVMFGGYRPFCGAVFPLVDDQAVVQDVAAYLIADNSFVLKPSGGPNGGARLDTHKKTTVTPIDYTTVRAMVQALQEWKEGKGREEVWFGTLNNFFPLHASMELKFLKNCWGNPKNLFRSCLIGYDPEAEPKIYDPGPPKDVEHNTFGAGGNILHEHSFPGSLVYQPLEEIRDYFGDDVGLYFAWLGLYTRMLFPNTILGFITMAAQIFPVAGTDFGKGLAKNPLTFSYSIYVGLWSISFLEAWHRRENELRFLWGSEHLKTTEVPRGEFKGVTRTNLETGRSYLAVENPRKHSMKKVASMFVCFLFILFTIASALAAQMVGYLGDANNPSWWERSKYQLASAVCNLAIIGIYGDLFERLAMKLTEFENLRTQSEFDNALVGKNFLFQFINNYFVLFYISFLREVKDPISREPHPCAGGNCLPELQAQLIVVFTGKTIGKQVAYTLKPFIFKWKESLAANNHTKKLVKQVSKGSIIIPAQMQTAMKEVVATTGGRNDPLQQLKNLKKLRDPYELQNHLMPYNGTFDDFNDRVIQFGYLVLFAPGYSLAPFFALVNNVIEIRMAGFKLCYAYQRPVWKARSGIGSWMVVMNVLGFFAVLTNASMITFVGSQDAESMGIVCNATAPITDSDRCGFFQRTRQWPLWLRFVITEHCVLCMRTVILIVSPTIPKWISDAAEVLQYRATRRYLTAHMLEEEKRAQAEYDRKMNDGFEIMKRHIRNFSEDDLHEMWVQADIDQSGYVDETELQLMFQTLGVHLTTEEIATAFLEIDESGDGEISYEEMIEWLMKKELWDPETAGTLPTTPGGEVEATVDLLGEEV